MTALIHALSHAFGTDAEIDTLEIIAIFSGVGLLFSLLSVLSGGPGFTEAELAIATVLP